MTRRLAILLIICILQCALLKAMPGNGQLLHFDISNGFPTNNVYSVIQDKHGYLWFATDNGVVRYNGYSLKIFNTSNGLPSNDVYQLYEDKRGRIWLLSLTYQFGYIQNDKYTALHLNLNDRVLNINRIADNGTFLFFCFFQHGTYSVGVVKEDVLGVFPIFYVYDIKPPSTSSVDVLSVRAATMDNTCKILAYSNGTWYKYDLLRPWKPLDTVCKIYEPYPKNDPGYLMLNSAKNLIYFQNRSNEVRVLNTRTCVVKYVSFEKEKGEFIYNFQVDNISPNKRESRLMTSEAVYSLDSNYEIISRRKINELIPVPGQIAYAFSDDFFNEWYTTNTKGAWCNYHKYYDSFATNQSFGPLTESKFVGYSTDGTAYWWNKSRSVLYNIDNQGKLNERQFPANSGLVSVAGDTDSTMYVSLGAGIYKYNTSSGKLTNIIYEKKKVVLDRFGGGQELINNDTLSRVYLRGYKLHPGNSANLFSISVYGLGVLKLSQDSIKVRTLTDERYTNILTDKFYKKVWAYNPHRLSIFDDYTSKQIEFGPDFFNKLGMQSIQNIEVDSYGNVYVLSNDKLFVYNPYLMNLTALPTHFNLQNSYFHIWGDHLIIAGKFGVAMATIAGPLTLKNFRAIPNINYQYYNQVFDFVIDGKDRLVLNTDKGVYCDRLSKLVSIPNLFKPYNTNFFRIVMEYPYQEKLMGNDTFSINQKDEKISLNAINYYGSGNVTYKYYVSGYGKDWQQSDGDIIVSNLSPGVYYKVLCVANDDLWRSNTVAFYVYRLPYWWQTKNWQIIFWLIGGGLMIALLLGTILLTRFIVARSNEKKRIMTELELKAIYAQINPHFIFNTLSAAQFFINKKRFDDAYNHVSKFSRLLRAYLKSSQDRYITLDEEVQMLKNYIELQQIRFEEKFEYRLEIENKIPVNSIKIPSLLLQPLVENAINHGLFHKEKDGLLILKFLQGAKSDELVCIIEDNGIGRKQSGIIKKESVGQKESYGTKLTQQLIDIYREYEHMDIYLEYIDKTEPESGTIVKLTIKNVKYVA